MVTYQESAFRALADPTRRAILDRLCRGPQPVNVIARAFPVSRPAVSKHLRLLREARLVRERRDGRRRIYHLNPAPLRRVDDWMERHRRLWTRKLMNLKRYVEAEEAATRKKRAAKRRRN